jgi:hypothetical protein
MALLEDELSAAERASVERQLEDSPASRDHLEQLRRVRAQLTGPSRAADGIDLVAAVQRSLGAPVRPSDEAPRALHWWLGGFASAAGIALAVAGSSSPASPTRPLPPPAAASDDFRAKASSEGEIPQWSSVHIYRVEADGEPSRVTGPLEKNSALLFSYANLAIPHLGYLMIFAVDSASEVFWFHPSRAPGGADATSLPVVRSGTHVPIPEVIRHDLALGDVEIYAVFTLEPLHTRDVEAWLNAHHGDRYSLDAAVGTVQLTLGRVVP